MPDKAASVLARLKTKSKESGRSFQLCLQLFAQEEFVRRLEKSRYSRDFILKGGLLIYSISGYESRATIDIDFLVKNMSNNLGNIEAVIRKIFKSDTGNDFIQFEITKVKSIAQLMKYPGVGFNIVAHIKNTRIPFGIDIGVGDVISPNYKKRKMPTQIEGFYSPSINTYSLESTIAEKLDAILSMMELSSRMKDYYDIYYLSCKFNFDNKILAEAIRKTFENRERSFTIDDFKRIMTFAENEDMLRKWNMFIMKLELDIHIEFEEVLSKMNVLLSPVFKTITTKKE